MGKTINGKKIAEKIYRQLKNEISELKKNGHIITLAVINLGEDLASKIYISNKKKMCEKLGINSRIFYLPNEYTEEKLLSLIRELNKNPKINGILVQLPLPNHIDTKKIIEEIDPKKDVDGFTGVSLEKLLTDDSNKDEFLLPCTPAGIMEIFHEKNICLAGKHCVIINRSNIVGKPLSMLMLKNDATVTVCHSKTQNLKEICKSADIIVSAVGKPNFITIDMVKPDAILIDVGISRDENGKVCGDVDFQNVKEVTSYITPVPGGVGPMTVAMLMKNTVKAAKLQLKDYNTNISLSDL